MTIRSQIHTLATILFSMFLQTSCSKGNDYAPAETAPLHEIIYNAGQLQHDDAIVILDSAMNEYPDEMNALMQVISNGISDSDVLYDYASSATVTMFTPAVHSLGVTMEYLNQNIGHILGSAMAEGLDISRKGYATAVWGKPQSILFCDSVMLIALNHYLGHDFKGYDGMPEYVRNRKTPEQLPYDLAEALVATSYPFSSDFQPNAINRMIYEGALTEAKMRLVKEPNSAQALGYTDEEFAWLEGNEKNIWERMVSSKLLFDSSVSTIERLIAPSPATTIISPKTPGRAGRYIGYKIVLAYVTQHPDATLEFLLSPQFYAETNPLISARYNP